MTHGIDVRSIRSDQCQVALRIFLQRYCVKIGAKTLILVDDTGRSLAWSDASVNPHEIAPHVAAVYRDHTPVPTIADLPQQAWPIEMGQGEGYLFAIGHPTFAAHDLQAAYQGITRILSDLQSPA